MKMKKITSFAVCMGLSAVLFTGCGSDGSQLDYVEGILNVAYNSDAINEKALDMSEKDIAAATKASNESEAKFLAAYFNMEDVSEDTEKAFEEIAAKIAMATDYTVEESGSGEVTVKIKPLKVTSDELEEFVEDFNVKKFVDADESCTEEAFTEGVVEILEKNMKNPQYGEEVTIKVAVTKKDGKYSISDEDMVKLDSAMFVYE